MTASWQSSQPTVRLGAYEPSFGGGAFYRVPFSVLVRLVIYRGIASNDSIQIYLFLPFAHLIFASLVSKSTHTDACSNSRVNCQPLRVVRL